MSISKKGNKKGNDAVASRLADFTGEKEVPIAGHNKMSLSPEQEDAYSGSECDAGMEELANSFSESAGFREGRDTGKVCRTLFTCI